MQKKWWKIISGFWKNPHAYLQAILKALVKFQKDQTKNVGGVKGTRYLHPIHSVILELKKSLS